MMMTLFTNPDMKSASVSPESPPPATRDLTGETGTVTSRAVKPRPLLSTLLLRARRVFLECGTAGDDNRSWYGIRLDRFPAGFSICSRSVDFQNFGKLKVRRRILWPGSSYWSLNRGPAMPS